MVVVRLICVNIPLRGLVFGSFHAPQAEHRTLSGIDSLAIVLFTYHIYFTIAREFVILMEFIYFIFLTNFRLFLDYFATSQLDSERATKVVSGIVKGCMEAECSLIGGETAEMPGLYKEGEYDLAGFVVGIVEDAQLIDGSSVTVGDKLVGVASSGLHSNGYSLVRKILIEHHKVALDKRVEEIGEVLGEELLKPTKIYVKTILNLIRDFKIGGIAHITGGGITGNLPRVIPKGSKALIRRGTWDIPPIFSYLKEQGNIPEEEMLRTFNNGIGMILVVRPKEVDDVLSRLNNLGEKAFVIGEIGKAEKEGETIEYL